MKISAKESSGKQFLSTVHTEDGCLTQMFDMLHLTHLALRNKMDTSSSYLFDDVLCFHHFLLRLKGCEMFTNKPLNTPSAEGFPATRE